MILFGTAILCKYFSILEFLHSYSKQYRHWCILQAHHYLSPSPPTSSCSWLLNCYFSFHFTFYMLLFVHLNSLIIFLFIFHIVQKTKISAFLSVCQRTAGQIDKVSVTDNMSVSFIFLLYKMTIFVVTVENFFCVVWIFLWFVGFLLFFCSYILFSRYLV